MSEPNGRRGARALATVTTTLALLCAAAAIVLIFHNRRAPEHGQPEVATAVWRGLVAAAAGLAVVAVAASTRARRLGTAVLACVALAAAAAVPALDPARPSRATVVAFDAASGDERWRVRPEIVLVDGLSITSGGAVGVTGWWQENRCAPADEVALLLDTDDGTTTTRILPGGSQEALQPDPGGGQQLQTSRGTFRVGADGTVTGVDGRWEADVPESDAYLIAEVGDLLVVASSGDYARGKGCRI